MKRREHEDTIEYASQQFVIYPSILPVVLLQVVSVVLDSAPTSIPSEPGKRQVEQLLEEDHCG